MFTINFISISCFGIIVPSHIRYGTEVPTSATGPSSLHASKCSGFSSSHFTEPSSFQHALRDLRPSMSISRTFVPHLQRQPVRPGNGNPCARDHKINCLFVLVCVFKDFRRSISVPGPPPGARDPSTLAPLFEFARAIQCSQPDPTEFVLSLNATYRWAKMKHIFIYICKM